MAAWHCYIEHHESVFTFDADAENPLDAAKLAAQQTEIDGLWCVVPGRPAMVKIETRHVYIATLVA